MVTPTFAIAVNSVDITQNLVANSADLSVTDNDGETSDELSVSVLGAYNMPIEGDVIQLWIGYKESGIWSCGLFVVQSLSFNRYATTIKATSTDFTQNLKRKRTATYKDTTLCEVVKSIATRSGLKLKCDIEENIAYLAQKDESDIHLLTRLSKFYNATFKIKNSILIFFSRTTRPTLIIDLNECSDYSGEWNRREKYKSCELSYHDSKENQLVSVKVGKDEPTLKLNEYCKNKEEATKRATNALKQSQRGTFKGSFTIVGMDIVAGAFVSFVGDSRLTGVYNITRVTHSIGSSGFSTSCDIEG